MERRQWLGLSGSAILCIGVFAPILTMPAVGTIDFFIGSKGNGTIIIALALVSILMAFSRKYRPLWYTGILSMVVTTYTFLSIRYELSTLSTGTLNETHLSWGWAVLILGAAMVVSTAAVSKRSLQLSQASS